ncbi:divalent metal cation transporter FieF [Oleiphilus sp. HI0117]|jgi:ferrous-iron efflux pump FieF|nr:MULTISPECIES: cation diffusion facilitator family transporter [unclassified Oleiphilus]KZY45314.1 divalent metal cation transporter FieF [Oleiphilus sp. HI0050]KZY63251.1 divalent metal cation transporter FieF [Oleiphilus sp. HI0061]KZZ31815.1 divalent metal cation transporter FieF [Oleiphilus sp. HI0086]KZZ37214.1 divalent metal cation transporter FieF [Oleiphilus sp. HI0117]KZZ58562.1 divalent metal cation transporter FieF [Oleiphilus sp. HI0123]
MRTKSEQLIIWATRASVAVAFTLLILKIYAWIVTGSMGVLAALVDSLLDLAASLINMFAVRYALEPADEEHRFGHGKAESLAGLGQAIFIGSSAIFLLMYTVERIFNPELIESPEIGTWVMLFSMALTLVLVAYQRYVVRKTNSIAVKADSLHYSADLVTNAGILLGLALYYMGWLYSDPIIALLIGLYILKCAIEIGYEAIQLLLDRELPDEEINQIESLACEHENVIEIHDLRTRQSGQTKFIQFHLVMDGNMTLLAAHDLADEVHDKIKEFFPQSDIIIHQDPHTAIANVGD